MQKIFFLTILMTLSFSLFAQESFQGKWKSQDSAVIFYSNMGRVDYDHCPAELEIEVKTVSVAEKIITFKKLKSICEHPENWTFNEKLPVFGLSLKNGLLTTQDGVKAGTMTGTKLDLIYDSLGQTFYLEAEITNGNMILGWYARSLEGLNYNVEGNYRRE